MMPLLFSVPLLGPGIAWFELGPRHRFQRRGGAHRRRQSRQHDQGRCCVGQDQRVRELCSVVSGAGSCYSTAAYR